MTKRPRRKCEPGLRVGMLVVIRLDETKPSRIASRRYWICQCDCGNSKPVRQESLVRARASSSCGCMVLERSRTHGDGKSAEYRCWTHIKGRCENPRDQAYRHYGGRGIRLAPEWLTDYPAFLAHVGRRPSPTHTLDRIDNNRGYEPGNVRWATRLEQARNTRRNVFVVTPDGETMTISSASKRYKVSLVAINRRIKLGLSPDQVFDKTRKYRTADIAKLRETSDAA